MRIAWITYDFEEYSTRHVNAMADDHDVLLVMPEPRDGAPRYDVHPSVDHYSFDKPRLRQPLKQLRTNREILRRVHDFKPDVVHYQQGHMWFNAALGSLKRYPLVITIHDPRHHAGDSVSRKTPQWLMDYGFRKADHVIVHGEALVDQVHEFFGLDKSCIDVIPHVSMGGEPPANEIQENPNHVLFFGRIWDYKGLNHLIEAEPLISQHIPDVKIVIGGEGEDFQRYRDMIRNPERFDIQNRWISDEERAEMFQRAAVVVLPYNEATQSGVVPVAYNFGKPVVATNVGALAECVDDEVTGLLVPPGDPQKLADAIVRILSDADLRLRMGAAGRDKLQRECSPEVVARQTVNAYAKAAGLPPENLDAADEPVAVDLQEAN